MVETIAFVRGNLPHWLVADRPYFVTICLKNALPGQVITELNAERERIRQDGRLDAEERSKELRRQFLKLDAILDACAERRDDLAQAEVAGSILRSLDWLEQSRGWRFYAVSLMPSHVHMVLRNVQGRNGELLTDLAHFKGFSGRAVNAILQRRGRFWAREDFDHWCRNQESVDRAMLYTIRNPVKARLVKRWDEWPWTRVKPEMLRSGKLPE